MLGSVAISCFLFGLMVGSYTAVRPASGSIECRVRGRVLWGPPDHRRPDEGAVVMLLPRDAEPDERFPALSVHPDSFQPLDNPAIDSILGLGGAIVRANGAGEFELRVNVPQSFDLLVVSKHRRRGDAAPLTRAQRARLGAWFSSASEAIGDQQFDWRRLKLDSSSYDLGNIEF